MVVRLGVWLVVGVVLGGCAGRASQPVTQTPEEIGGGEIHGAELGVDSERDRLAAIVMQDDREALPDELAAIRELMAEAEKIRGLRFLREFEVRVQTDKAIQAYLRTEVDERRLRRARDSYVALGLLSPEVTGDQIMEEVSKTELQGYYDPTYQRLVVRDDVAMALGSSMRRLDTVVLRSVVLHELVHALQDQHFGLEKQIFSRRSTDGHQAFMSLMEGDATLAMMHYQVVRAGLDFDALVNDQPLFDRIFTGLPPIHGVSAMDAPQAHRPGTFRYRAGALFAAGVVRDGGQPALNRAYRRPPPTTRQVMDYGLFVRDHGRPTVNRIPAKLLERHGHELLHEDSMGRIELSGYMSAGGAGGDILATGWRADRLLVFRQGEQLGSIWIVLMEDPEQADVVTKRGEDAVGRKTRAAGGTYRAFHVLDAAVLMRNVEDATAPAMEQALRRWLMSQGAIEYPPGLSEQR